MSEGPQPRLYLSARKPGFHYAPREFHHNPLPEIEFLGMQVHLKTLELRLPGQKLRNLTLTDLDPSFHEGSVTPIGETELGLLGSSSRHAILQNVAQSSYEDLWPRGVNHMRYHAPCQR